MTQAHSFDVVVLGGGPAGAAVALTLRHYSSLSVAVIEKSNYDSPRIGETLSPGVQGRLKYLKVWDAFVADEHQPSFGTSAAWGSSQVQTRDFIFSPLGAGWHLDRRRFDRMLADAVVAAEGTVWCKAQMVHYQRRSANQWHLIIEREGEPTEVRARFLVDATGKAASFVKKEGIQRWMMDRLVGIVGTFQFPQAVPQDTFTLVETCETGWWYSARLPGAAMIVAFMSDADMVQKQKLHSVDAWLKALAQMEHTSGRLQRGQLAGELRIYAAHSAYMMQMAGEGWLAAGDTATSHDPLSSSGIPRALDSGMLAARAIYDFLQHGKTAALQSYQATLKQSFDLYLATKIRYYQMEQRWPQSPFWQRRQQVVTLSPLGVVHFARQSINEEVWETLNMDLTRRQYKLLGQLCATPAPAYEVVAAFQQKCRRRIPDQRVILALQNMVERGIVGLE
jgi:flavin-dependent dehydrogenase